MHGLVLLNAILEEQIPFIYSAGSFIVVNVERHFMVILSHVIIFTEEMRHIVVPKRGVDGIVARVEYLAADLKMRFFLPFDHMYYFLRQ